MEKMTSDLLLPEAKGGGRFWRRSEGVPLVGDWVLDNFGGVWVPIDDDSIPTET